MPVRRILKQAIKAAMERNGYWVRHKSVLPFGIEYQADIRRLADMLGIPVNVFFDVGAHTGQTSHDVLRNFENAEIFAFEPHPVTFTELRTKVQSPRVRMFNLALSDRNGAAEFFEYGHLATCNSLVGNNQFAIRSQNVSRTLNVECMTLDRFCDEQGVDQIDVLKVDTEGHDLAVLKGGLQSLASRGVGFVYIEFNSMLPKPKTSGGALLPIASLLEPLGFCFVASYPECMLTSGELFVTGNALFVRSQGRSTIGAAA